MSESNIVISKSEEQALKIVEKFGYTGKMKKLMQSTIRSIHEPLDNA